MADTPKKVDEIRKDAKMMAAYLAYAKKSLFLNEVMFYVNKGNNYKAIYTKYLYGKSKDQVNVDGKVYKAGDTLAAKADWENSAWPKIIAAGKKEVKSSLDGGIYAFTSSDFYKDYVKKTKMGDPKKAAKLLGLGDPKKLAEMMGAQAVGDKTKAKKLWDEIAKKEKIKANYEATVKALQKGGLI